MPVWARGASLPWALVLLAMSNGLRVQDALDRDTVLYQVPSTSTRRDGRALPSTIIVSSPMLLKVRPKGAASPPKASQEAEDDTKYSYIPLSSSKTQEEPEESAAPAKENPNPVNTKESGVGVKSKIKFHTIHCTSDKPCSTIIQAPVKPHNYISSTTTTNSSSSRRQPFTQEQIKRYLQQFSLRQGFRYGKEFEESGTPDASRGPSRGRMLLRDPKWVLLEQDSKYEGQDPWYDEPWSPGSVYRYQTYRPEGFDPHKSPVTDWDSVYASFPSRHSTTGRPKYSPPSRPLTPDTDNSETSGRRPSRPRRPSTNGVWSRYSTSTITQLDKNSGQWVKVSSSGPHKDKSWQFPSHSHPTQQTQVQLTVLGVDEDLDTPRGNGVKPETHMVVKPNDVPGHPPAVIETSSLPHHHDYHHNYHHQHQQQQEEEKPASSESSSVQYGKPFYVHGSLVLVKE
ncbi:uncharacterized protein LOC123512427 [Portunus trituberculatus]|uniref:uncharacterized protein LOC123512427 n=1 Tax=Portunus trituberculatus TaxID=210409 RepID=UPI001E1CFAAF|nr:uncharacterized protein LOC123512427 [Portunus trituberculatus]